VRLFVINRDKRLAILGGMDIRLEMRGLAAVANRLQKIEDRAWLEKASDVGIRILQETLAAYPPAPPGSSYRRTGTLGRNWRIHARTMADGRVVRTVRNLIPYAPFVQSRRLQARIHRKRWITDVQAVAQTENQIADLFRNELQKVSK